MVEIFIAEKKTAPQSRKESSSVPFAVNRYHFPA